MNRILHFYITLAFAIISNAISAQNYTDAELDRLWNQAEFWEKAGNVNKTIEYKEKLVDLYRKNYMQDLPLILRNIANTYGSYGSLSESFRSKSEDYFIEALDLISKRQVNDDNLTLYYNCLLDMVGWNFERKEYSKILNKIQNYHDFLIKNSSKIHKEEVANIRKARYNSIIQLNDSCQKLKNNSEYELASNIMDSYVPDFIELLRKDSLVEEISNLCLSTVWQYADILSHVEGKKETSIELYELHNKFLRNNLEFYLRAGMSIDYLWVMERFLANIYFDLGNRQKDIEISERIVNEARIHNDSLLLSEKLMDLGVSYERNHTLEGRNNSQPIFEESLNILTKLQINQDVDNKILRVLELLLGEYVLCGHYNKVIDLCSSYKDVLNKEYNSEGESLLIEILRWKSSAYHHLSFSPLGSRAESHVINNKILDYQQRKYGKASVQYLTQLRLASFAYLDCDTLELDSIYSEGVKLWNGLMQNKYTREYSSFLVTYFNYLLKRGLTERASSVSKKIEELFSIGSIDLHTVINYYYDYSINEYNNCRYDQAMEYIEKALFECEKHRDNSEIEEKTAMILCQKSNIAFCQGKYDIAKECAYTAYNIIEKYDNPNLLKSDILYSLSYLMDNFGEKEKSIEMSMEAFNISYKCEGIYTPLDKVSSTINRFDPKTQINLIDTLHIENFLDNPEVVDLFITKAAAYINLGIFDCAEVCLTQAEKYLNKFIEDAFYQKGDRKKLIKSSLLYNRGVLESWRKNYNKAISYFTDYRNLLETDTSLPWLNTMYALVKNSSNFSIETKKALEYIRKEISDRFVYLSDHERELYMANKLSSAINEIESYAGLYPELSFSCRAAFDAVLLEKGLALSASSEIQQIIDSSSVNTEYLRDLKKQLNIASNIETRSSIQIRIGLEEQKLQKQNGEKLNHYLGELLVDIDDVKNNLKVHSAIVEFIRNLDFRRSTPLYTYGALVLTKELNDPIYISICTEEELASLKERNTEIYDREDKYAYNLIWKPLLPYLSGKKVVYFSPTGLLHLLNIELIAHNSIEEVDFVRLSSSRELCKDVRAISKENDVVLFGGLCYDCEAKDSLFSTKHLAVLDVTDSITRSGISFLPGSLDEIKNISNIAATKSLESTVYSGKEGSEYNYKLLSGKNIPIMHISTHGFSLGHNTIQEYNDPMRRCGLLMSGSLEAWNGNPRPNMEDGILLGEEIANVRLRNNELVVLSACESALGVTTSEGVWGLQRSFKKAGGKTILMSLWKVSDLATTLLMNTFYENLFSGCSKHESLRNAQHYVKEFEDDNGNKPFESPYYWAAWILLDALN